MYNTKPQPRLVSISAEDIEKLQSGKKKMNLKVGLQTAQGSTYRMRTGARVPRTTIRY